MARREYSRAMDGGTFREYPWACAPRRVGSCRAFRTGICGAYSGAHHKPLDNLSFGRGGEHRTF